MWLSVKWLEILQKENSSHEWEELSRLAKLIYCLRKGEMKEKKRVGHLSRWSALVVKFVWIMRTKCQNTPLIRLCQTSILCVCM